MPDATDDDARPHYHVIFNHDDDDAGHYIDVLDPCRDDDCAREPVYVLTGDEYRAIDLYINACFDGAVPLDDPRDDPAAFVHCWADDDRDVHGH